MAKQYTIATRFKLAWIPNRAGYKLNVRLKGGREFPAVVEKCPLMDTFHLCDPATGKPFKDVHGVQWKDLQDWTPNSVDQRTRKP